MPQVLTVRCVLKSCMSGCLARMADGAAGAAPGCHVVMQTSKDTCRGYLVSFTIRILRTTPYHPVKHASACIVCGSHRWPLLKPPPNGQAVTNDATINIQSEPIGCIAETPPLLLRRSHISLVEPPSRCQARAPARAQVASTLIHVAL